MRPVGAARRGDVVFVVADGPFTPNTATQVTAAAEALADETGVRLIVLGNVLFPVGLVPFGRFRARRGVTPRWTRSAR